MEKLNHKIILAVVAGIGLGFLISDITTVSEKELLVSSSSELVTGDEEDVNFANSLGLASFDGAWISVTNEKIVNDVNSVYINCWLERKICDIAQANVVDGSIYNDLDYYGISQWSDTGQITATAESVCEEQVLKADIKTKVVTLTESRKSGADNTMCSSQSSPSVLKLGSRGL